MQVASYSAWSGSLTTASSATFRSGVIPFDRLSVVRSSLWRHPYIVMVERLMSTRKRSTKPPGEIEKGRQRLPAELSRVNLNAAGVEAGIDVGASSHFVAVPQDRAEPEVREFDAYTGDLYRLADWLAECEVATVVMESTGMYWIPLFGVLAERGFEVMLVDPRRIKAVATFSGTLSVASPSCRGVGAILAPPAGSNTTHKRVFMRSTSLC